MSESLANALSAVKDGAEFNSSAIDGAKKLRRDANFIKRGLKKIFPNL